MTSIDHTRATVEQLAEFDTIIDARSPAEFAEDHIPGAINCPVLDDEQRIIVGTLYKQASPFEARKVGAVLVARNVANHIETYFADKPKNWKPLVYCWRGGQRSGAFTHILREVGWSAKRLQGGYKSWRHHVIEQLGSLPQALRFTVVAGPTGSAKTRVLEALERLGHQVLNLEALAQHKGSVLGDLPGQPQPSQKMFETLVLAEVSRFDPARPVFVESESKRVGQLRVPDAVFQGIQSGNWVRVQASMEERVQFLLRDYDYFLSGPVLEQQLDRLKELCGGETVSRWKSLAASKEFATLVAELLSQHYDRFYLRSLNNHAEASTPQATFVAQDLSVEGIEALARAIGAAAS
ncbi:tRNA 2-selenouridine(34) synthase MnmH [Rhodoferax sp. GW822-FHT02A01]|uniref:tRNA 2-selenouridine(34) synthase MnmH n=1 Tax=Rhodoferax sp. GW822-FHT02A01 TaxID=3141537 RepID=UPI00315D34D1